MVYFCSAALVAQYVILCDEVSEGAFITGERPVDCSLARREKGSNLFPVTCVLRL